ncbi:MAG: hypothetical protein D6800_07850 [Candidatus Zixiibacteriota bacterium]|nr:MAG: hypothetical protein D6800_07850 [candidate division Zixibacteria bacterium]
MFARHGFDTEFFATTPIESLSVRQRVLRPVKRIVTKLGLMPKSMAGKKLLKRLVFGRLVPMPAEVVPGMMEAPDPEPIPADVPCADYKVILCRATRT